MAHGEEDFIFIAEGGLTVKSLDRHNKRLISTVDWHAVAHAVEEWIHFHHGIARAEAFTAHHKLVMDLCYELQIIYLRSPVVDKYLYI